MASNFGTFLRRSARQRGRPLPRILLLAAALILAAVSARAATVSDSDDSTPGPTEINFLATLNKFDSSLGTLTAVQLTLRANITSQLSVQNVTGSTQSNDSSGQSEYFIDETPILAALDLGIPDPALTASFPYTGGPVNIPANSTVLFGPFTENLSQTFNIAPSDFGLFQAPGGGTFDLRCATLSGLTSTGGGNFTRLQSTTGDCGFTVTYTFTPNERIGACADEGSVVIVPFDITRQPGSNISVLRLTNNHPNDDVRVHLVRVCGAQVGNGGAGFCTASNREVELTHNQTRAFNIERFFQIDADTCPTGFVVAYAEDDLLGPNQPISWNRLTGSIYVRGPGGPGLNWTMASQACTVESPQPAGAPIGTGGAFPTLPFNGLDYALLPKLHYTDFRATTGPRASALWLMTLDIQAGAPNPPTVAALDWWNKAEDQFSNSHQYVCQTRVPLHEVSSQFTLAGLGSETGNLKVTPAGTDVVIGFIEEISPNRRTLRPLFTARPAVGTVFTGR